MDVKPFVRNLDASDTEGKTVRLTTEITSITGKDYGPS
jgi:hypothetical protein